MELDAVISFNVASRVARHLPRDTSIIRDWRFYDLRHKIYKIMMDD